MIEVLLIQPKIGEHDYLRSDFVPQLSLLYISTLIHKRYDIKIFDQRLHENWKKKLVTIIESNHLICVGISSMIGQQIFYALSISKFIKKIYHDIKLV